MKLPKPKRKGRTNMAEYQGNGEFIVTHLLKAGGQIIPVMWFEEDPEEGAILYSRGEWESGEMASYTWNPETEMVELQGSPIGFELMDAEDAETPEEKILTTSTLEQLLETLLSITATLPAHRTLEEVVDLTSLPTFGGEEPEDTEGVFSWDKERLLAFDSRWEIVLREEE
jgi:hypothetical protein